LTLFIEDDSACVKEVSSMPSYSVEVACVASVEAYRWHCSLETCANGPVCCLNRRRNDAVTSCNAMAVLVFVSMQARYPTVLVVRCSHGGARRASQNVLAHVMGKLYSDFARLNSIGLQGPTLTWTSVTRSGDSGCDWKRFDDSYFT
jgi:hypothetical protein